MRSALVSVLLCAFVSAMGYGEKPNMWGISCPEEIDPLAEKALDFLETDSGRLRTQAETFARAGKYMEAARCYLTSLRANANDPVSLYNLACCYGKLRQAGLAVKSLISAFTAGFRDFALLRSDPDFRAIRESPEFMNLLTRIPGWEESLGETLFVKTERIAELLVKIPRRFDTSRKYPLLVGLHGNGGSAENMLATLFNGLNAEPLILAAPQGAYANFPYLRGRHFSWELQTQNRELWKSADPLVVDNIERAIRVLQERYPVAEVYILGFSQGAAYAFLTGFKHPELISGIISIGGLLPEADQKYSMLKETEIKAGGKIRVFIAQGNSDPALPEGLAARNAEKLKNYGYRVEYHEYEGGHEINPELLSRIYSWMGKR